MFSDIHESRQAEFQRATIGMTVLATNFVVLRCLARWKKSLQFGIDDYGILVSLCLLFGDAGCNLTLVYYGMGLHVENLPTENLVIMAKIGTVLMAYECVYNTTKTVIKIPILLLYIRIFPTRGFRIAAHILGAITSWDPTLPGSCIDRLAPVIGNAVPNILTDIAILSLPIRMVWKLQAPVVFCSIYRFTIIFKIRADEISWTIGDASTWCVIQCASGIISGCMPTLRPLYLMISSPFGNSQAKNVPANGNEYRSSVGSPAFRPKGEVLAKNDVRMATSLEAYGDEAPLDKYYIRLQRDVIWQEPAEDGSAHTQR
ncbi:hypothetical protein BDV19DRAFT_399300 [Aspergillus venezuelensis]